MQETEMEKDILVSVVMMVYNHQQYLRKALDSVLDQRVNFPIEIIVGDDCSNDSSQEILREYDEKYPGIFTMVLRKTNLGPAKNDYDLHMRARGKYIAHLEGDDYWTDEYKLQKQVDFLEANPQYSACTHNYTVVDANNRPHSVQMLWWQSDKDFYTIDDIPSGKIAGQTGTLVNVNYFADASRDYSVYTQSLIPDRWYMLFLAAIGPIVKLEDNMSCYRYIVNQNSFTSNTAKNFSLRIDYYLERLRLEDISRNMLGKPLNLKEDKNRIFRNDIAAYLAKPSFANYKTMMKICALRSCPPISALYFWGRIFLNFLKKVVSLPKRAYKAIRDRHHAYLIELLRKAVVASQNDLNLTRRTFNLLQQQTNKLKELSEQVDSLNDKYQQLLTQLEGMMTGTGEKQNDLPDECEFPEDLTEPSEEPEENIPSLREIGLARYQELHAAYEAGTEFSE